MSCDLRCRLRLLLEVRVPLAKLISLDELRSKISSDTIDGLTKRFLASEGANAGLACGLRGAITEVIVAAAVAGALPLYVADPERLYAHEIRTEAIRTGCCCWSAGEAIDDGRFIVKPRYMRHHSLQAELDGQAVYVRIDNVRRFLDVAPMSEKKLRDAVRQVIQEATLQGLHLVNSKILERVKANPEVRASDMRIKKIIGEEKPKEWTRPGRRPSSR